MVTVPGGHIYRCKRHLDSVDESTGSKSIQAEPSGGHPHFPWRVRLQRVYPASDKGQIILTFISVYLYISALTTSLFISNVKSR